MAKRKMKTRKAAAKRYKVSATGKIIVSRAGVRHLAAGSSRKSRRQRKGMAAVDKRDWPMAHAVLPYGSTI